MSVGLWRFTGPHVSGFEIGAKLSLQFAIYMTVQLRWRELEMSCQK